MSLFSKAGTFIFIIIAAIGCTTQQPTGAARGAIIGSIIGNYSLGTGAPQRATSGAAALTFLRNISPNNCLEVLQCINDNYPNAKTMTHPSSEKITRIELQDQYTILLMSHEPQSPNHIGNCGINIYYPPKSNNSDNDFTYILFLTLHNCKNLKNKEATIDTFKPPPPIKNGTS